MMYLGEYRAKPDRLSDLLPWAALVAPGVVLNKDGSFLRVLKFRGPDLDSATEAQVFVGSSASAKDSQRYAGALEHFLRHTERIADILGNALHEVAFLSDEALLTFLHGTVSTKLHPVAVPETPAYLDMLLADCPLVGGLQPRPGRDPPPVLPITRVPPT